ncbi:anti-sigma factor domain-containing protein [Cryobacterium sp. Y50]|uniref:anti-sigma factor n=1 Tax=Cryobacterium sp. Y50 TaxID=2048286 RepID=UPI000CE4E7D2|nr:anti-sigma factor [Cryobacterium sp. Y50]
MTGRNEQHPADLAGAYALHALDADDTAAFESHLAESERARIETAELNDTAVALGLAVAPVQPSAALKANLMSMLASTPQLAPLPRAVGPATTDAATAVSETTPVVSPVTSGTAPSGPVTGIRSGDASSPHRSSATERAKARWFKRPALYYLLAAAAAAALFVGGSLFGQTLNNDEFESQQAAGLAQINAADDSQRAATTTAEGQEATLVWSNKLGISAVLVADLPVLPSDQDYQLWYINGDGPASAGTFDSTGDGPAWRVLDGTMHAGDQVGITVEPNGGSDQPSSTPIVAFQS